jgi:hypothetical protein
MTIPEDLSPAYWRGRAEEARLAAADVHPANRKILDEVAASYEEMADLLELAQRRRAPELPRRLPTEEKAAPDRSWPPVKLVT